MDFVTQCFTVSEQMLFNFPEYVDTLLKDNPDVKSAGVFKVVTEEGVRNQGTSLKDILSIDKSRFMNVQKQFVVGFKEHPNLYGYRGFKPDVTDLNLDTSCNDNAGRIDCSVQDAEEFITSATDPSAYMATTCCTDLLACANGEEATVNHFLGKVLPAMSLKRKVGANRQLLSKVEAQGKADSKKFKKFHSALLLLSVEEKLKLVQRGLDSDERQCNEECECSGCSHEGQCFETKPKNKGIMYGAGIELKMTDRIKMSKNFGLFCLSATSLLRLLKHHYPGITLPFLYFGSTHSIFPIHIEDASLFSINYLHYGAPKLWICVPPTAVLKLHLCLSGLGVDLSQTACNNLLGHKFFYPTVQWLKDNKIPYKVVIQRAGECVVVTPNTAHFGFNLGRNLAEAANFPTPGWIPYGMVAPKCTCMGFEVHLNMERIVAAVKPHWLKAYRRNEIPEVSMQEDPNFYHSILRVNSKVLGSISKNETSSEGSTDEEDTRDETPIELPLEKSGFPELPAKGTGRKLLPCPKATCPFIEKNGKRQRLLDHIQKHKIDSNFNEIQDSFDVMCPPRDKTKSKRTCDKCGKVVAGRGAQLRIHQSGTACKKNSLKKK